MQHDPTNFYTVFTDSRVSRMTIVPKEHIRKLGQARSPELQAMQPEDQLRHIASMFRDLYTLHPDLDWQPAMQSAATTWVVAGLLALDKLEEAIVRHGVIAVIQPEENGPRFLLNALDLDLLEELLSEYESGDLVHHEGAPSSAELNMITSAGQVLH